ncbi:MAG: protease-like activity factor CPAF, partial [Exilibacterium sp.]
MIAEQSSSAMAESDDDLAGGFEWPELKYDDQQVHLEDLVEDATVDQNPYQFGGRKSYIPALGEIVEEAPEESIFYWSKEMGEEGKNYGYLRLPSYDGSVSNYNAFGQTVNRLEANTEKLILDQNHNPGGSVLYLYALVSLFADILLEFRYHQVKTVAFNVQEIEQRLTWLDAIDSDEGAKEIFGDSIQGYNVDLKFVQEYSVYLRGVLSEKLAGKELTRALPLVGIEKIEPNTTYHYTKPVILLTDALCFSGGDFFPAIMQDNDRMLLVGQNTAGAGGYVNQIEGSEFPASIKISSIRYTGSLAWRSNGFP